MDADFPLELLPEDTGVICADSYDAEVIRDAPLEKLAPARRKAMTLKIGRVAAQRLTRALDPEMGRMGVTLLARAHRSRS